MDHTVARSVWLALEPYHAVVYFAPEAREEYARAGLKGGWMGYFASRSAAMGPVGPEVVTATFYNFHPAMVRRAIPDAWTLSTPARVLEARAAVADAATRRQLGDAVGAEAVDVAATLARRAAEVADTAGRPLAAAHAGLPWPDEAHLVLWHAATVLREHRGDGHNATLLSEGIDGCEAHVLLTAEGRYEAASQRSFRGWSEDEWRAAEDRLRARGLIDADVALTDAGRELRAHVERRTDELALAPYRALGESETDDLLEAARALSTAGATAGVPYPNPMGLPKARA